ncbi:biosynthetic-type acetolactate synthase large subunit [Candidatus Venteria ishoeyi]|uniref:Acetolactate synthase n=1 Tax=Candidatus Venteria ishoeyi TaxID=1899563 RepID=A0A1H6F3F5_9GAMM|nr:biosynthetic-type acetolactate synthase large subunit [Candidatus Venteria ishoeyi]MDM8545210.1 biosynthetic-type acetolactate synthase large subunit [Candidatus Venteria ishoeyi]SEH04687.1 Acetolactate synthase isozyme 3 large subunit [Candidatus Venteria ishoeyi]
MANETEALTGAEILVRCFEEEGVEYVFGYPGGSVLHIYDALFKRDHNNKIQHILVRHEQAATHAADGYSRATGKPGVVLVTSGPGATNAVTGIATAHMDSIPMVVITGQVPRSLIGNDAFQEVDSVGITRPCVKHNFLVNKVEDLAETVKKAFYIATTGRPGPVVIDIPKDVTADQIAFHYPHQVEMRSYKPSSSGHPKQINKASELLLGAKRPMIYSGGGVVLSEASKELTELTRMLGFPITNTLMGLGAYPASDKQFVGMLGMHGTYEANMAMHECDVLLAVGARFDDRVTSDINKFCPHAKIIHIDIDPSSISKNVRVDIPIVGDVREVLHDLIKTLKGTKQQPDSQALADWWVQIQNWQEKNCLYYDRGSNLIKPQFVIETLSKLMGDDGYVTSDVGQHQMWAAQYFNFNHPRRWINSGGLGTMGFGLPAAIGTQLAHPDSPVVCITGEASIQMCIQELATCKQYDLPIKVVMLNNRYMGMVRQWQEMFYDKRYSHSYVDALPDFVKLAESYGHAGMLIEKPANVEQALKDALAINDRLVFMNFITDSAENVFPMVAAGKGQHEMVLSPLSPGMPIDRELT